MKIIGFCLICWHDITERQSYRKVNGGLVHLKCWLRGSK